MNNNKKATNFDLKLLVNIKPENLVKGNIYIICGYPENKKEWISGDFVIGSFVENYKSKSLFKNLSNIKKNIIKGYTHLGVARWYFYEYDQEKFKFEIVI
jgi:hypothetical protein